MNRYAVTIVELERLRPTEEVDAARVEALVAEIGGSGQLDRPILVERESLAILDGHHRYRAARLLGLVRIAAIALDYQDPRLTLASWSERRFTPDEVLRAAATGKLLPQKSTRHILEPEPPPQPVPLGLLRAAG